MYIAPLVVSWLIASTITLSAYFKTEKSYWLIIEAVATVVAIVFIVLQTYKELKL